MLVHNHPTNFTAVDLYSSKAAERAASAQRAADVRRKLMKGGLDGEVDPFGSFLVGEGPEGGSGQRQDQNQNHANTAGRLQLADEEQADQPLSF
jgi:hypothetical protein